MAVHRSFSYNLYCKIFQSFYMAFDSELLKYFKDHLFKYKYLSFLYIFKEVGSLKGRSYIAITE